MKRPMTWPERLGFRNNYLAPLLIALAFFSNSVRAQYDTTKPLQKQNAFGFEWKHMRFDSTARMPKDTFRGKLVDTGMQANINGTIYTWNLNRNYTPWILRWDPVAKVVNDSTLIINGDTVHLSQGGTTSTTLQQALDNGSTLNKDNTVDFDGNDLVYANGNFDLRDILGFYLPWANFDPGSVEGTIYYRNSTSRFRGRNFTGWDNFVMEQQLKDSSANKLRAVYRKPGTDSVFARVGTVDVFQFGGGSVTVKDSLGYISYNYGFNNDGITDNATILQSYINSGYTDFFFKKGTYIIGSNIQLKNGVRLRGSGDSTVFKFSGNYTMFSLSLTGGGTGAAVTGIQFRGTNGSGGNSSQKVFVLDSVYGVTIEGNYFDFIAGDVITIKNNGYLPFSAFTHGNSVINNRFKTCAGVGVKADVRGEYNTIAHNNVSDGGTGFDISGGNNIVMANHANQNNIGFILRGGSNNGHGVFSGNVSNHNATYGLWATGVSLGFPLHGNNFYADSILIDGCDNINIMGGDIDAPTRINNSTNIHFTFPNFKASYTLTTATSTGTVMENSVTGFKITNIVYPTDKFEIATTDDVGYLGGANGAPSGTGEIYVLREMIGRTGVARGQRDAELGSFGVTIPSGNAISDPNQIYMKNSTGSGLAIYNDDRYALKLMPNNSVGFGVEFSNTPDANFAIDNWRKTRLRDTTRADARISYQTNIAATYTEYSHVTKHDLDSAMAAGGGGGVTITDVREEIADSLNAFRTNVDSVRHYRSGDSVFQCIKPAGGIEACYFQYLLTNHHRDVSGVSSTTSDLTYTTADDGAAHTYVLSNRAYISEVSAATLTCTVSYTDENAQSRTLTYFNMGTTTAAFSATGPTQFPVAGEIKCAPNTSITFVYTIAGTSMVFDYSFTITRIK